MNPSLDMRREVTKEWGSRLRDLPRCYINDWRVPIEVYDAVGDVLANRNQLIERVAFLEEELADIRGDGFPDGQ